MSTGELGEILRRARLLMRRVDPRLVVRQLKGALVQLEDVAAALEKQRKSKDGDTDA